MDRRDNEFPQPVIRNRKIVLTLIDEETEEETEHELPFKYDVCPTCEGKGSHVNPSIDSHGISAEEFAEDPDFEEAYFEGRYDVQCAQCRGLRVIAVVDERLCTDEEKQVLKQVYEAEENEASYRSERAAERRMGY